MIILVKKKKKNRKKLKNLWVIRIHYDIFLLDMVERRIANDMVGSFATGTVGCSMQERGREIRPLWRCRVTDRVSAIEDRKKFGIGGNKSALFACKNLIFYEIIGCNNMRLVWGNKSETVDSRARIKWYAQALSMWSLTTRINASVWTERVPKEVTRSDRVKLDWLRKNEVARFD